MEHIERKVRSLVSQFQTNCPFKLAKLLGIQVVHEQLGNTMGYYSKHFRIKIIHLNEKLDTEEKEFVCAHELGHAIHHPDANTPFLKKHTLFSTEKIEQEANVFALNLLFLEKELHEQYSIETALNKYGIPQKLLRDSNIFF
ncbi:ImmA/IrrE family metallo-endopeptidase [Robertmurraya kyonggiensis]|uniref:ImmA/IrrE family metallo-endopeptidase n=1 Tax=Robertmurraya kyonggiensis TaxID=1037680 RepID=A0A4V5P320_9BACI|nr:ImmA/IrrE family metallo-endopeptidase [Robertmurraya kyonggiensis]TKC15710.1 ImmA/IrrE family metallo-endopeptidase [Robertmurraya kyonggiensis]